MEYETRTCEDIDNRLSNPKNLDRFKSLLNATYPRRGGCVKGADTIKLYVI